MATAAGMAWTLAIVVAVGMVFLHSEARTRDEAAVQAAAAVGRIRDTLATLSRTDTVVMQADTGDVANCPRARAVTAMRRMPQQVPYSARLMLGPCCYPDTRVAEAMTHVIEGATEQGTVRYVGDDLVYQQVTAIPPERCGNCHPKRTGLPAVVVDVPLDNIRTAEMGRSFWAFAGFSAVWLMGLGFVTHMTQNFRGTARELEQIRDDYLEFFDESPTAALLLCETADGLFGPIRRANARAAQELNRSAEEIVGMPIGAVLDRLDPVSQRALVKSLRTQGHVIAETAMLPRERHKVPVEAEFSLFEFEAEPTVLVFLRDLGDRRAAEHAMARRDRRLELLSSVTRRLAEHLDAKLVLRDLVASAMQLVDATGGMAGLVDGEFIEFKEAFGLDGREPIDLRVPVTCGCSAVVLETHAPYITNDAPRDPYVLPELRERADFMSLVAVPILDSEGKAIGILEVHDQIHGPFDDEDAIALMGVAASAGVAIENARVVQQLLATKEQLLAYQAELRQLAEELSVAQERERRIIAVELHDGIGQNLAILRMKLGQAAKRLGSEGEGALADAKQLLEATIGETRSLTFQLSPPVLYELGLSPALEWLCEKLEEEHGVTFWFTEQGEAGEVEEDIRALLYAATRELLLNVVKHAEAREAHVTLTWSEHETLIEVRDDGKGLPAEGVVEKRAGFGLFGVRERLRALGGVLQLASEPGEGTRAWIEVPTARYLD